MSLLNEFKTNKFYKAECFELMFDDFINNINHFQILHNNLRKPYKVLPCLIETLPDCKIYDPYHNKKLRDICKTNFKNMSEEEILKSLKNKLIENKEAIAKSLSNYDNLVNLLNLSQI